MYMLDKNEIFFISLLVFIEIIVWVKVGNHLYESAKYFYCNYLRIKNFLIIPVWGTSIGGFRSLQ